MLYVTIAINDTLLYHVGIQRINPVNRLPNKDEECTYNLLDDENNVIRVFTHVYGDGALRCAEKAIKILIKNETNTVLPTERRGL